MIPLKKNNSELFLPLFRYIDNSYSLGKKVGEMKSSLTQRLSFAMVLLVAIGVGSAASASGADLGVASTSLGKVIVDSKGMTAYFYQPDVPNSGVSSCTGGCLSNWPAITAATATPSVTGITAKVTVISGTNQLVINGRPIYTFVGDQKPGDTNGQGIEGIWYAVSPAGIELTPAEIAKEKAPISKSKPKVTTHRSNSSGKSAGNKKVLKKKVAPKPSKTPTNSYYSR